MMRAVARHLEISGREERHHHEVII
jgi:hypothetical protein